MRVQLRKVFYFTHIVLFLTIFTLAYLQNIGCSPTKHQHSIQSETARLMVAKTFILYAKKGEFKKFDTLTAKLVKSGKTDDFRNGELQYTIISPNTAIFSANQGTGEVEMIRDHRSITFIETTPFGNKMIAVIYDEWNEKEKGFRFTYTRNVEFAFSNSIMRSTYTGIAKIE